MRAHDPLRTSPLQGAAGIAAILRAKIPRSSEQSFRQLICWHAERAADTLMRKYEVNAAVQLVSQEFADDAAPVPLSSGHRDFGAAGLDPINLERRCGF